MFASIFSSFLRIVGHSNLRFSRSFPSKEIYAPKIQEFAYVTDGACSEDDIIRMELIMLKVITVFVNAIGKTVQLSLVF